MNQNNKDQPLYPCEICGSTNNCTGMEDHLKEMHNEKPDSLQPQPAWETRLRKSIDGRLPYIEMLGFISKLLEEERLKWQTPRDLGGDTPCKFCGTEENIVWFTDNTFWNEVVDRQRQNPILCINCFVELAEKKFKITGWRVLPEFPWLPSLTSPPQEETK